MKQSFLYLLFIVTAFCAACEKDTTTTTTCDTASGTSQDCSTKTGIAKIVCLAENLKAELCTSQQSTVQLDYTSANAKKWSNLPAGMSARLGMRFGDMTAKQLAAAKALLQAISGSPVNEGYAELQQLWAADDYLSANGGGTTYGAGQYYIALLGTPSATGTWQIQAGGHHVAVAMTYENGVLTGATPSFRAVEPFGAFTANGASVQPIVQERDALAAMFSSLTTAELASAKLSNSFSDILLGPGKDGQFPAAKVGLKVGLLTTAQKTAVLNAIKTYVDDIDDANAATILATYTAEIDDTYIAFSGNSSLSVKNDYVRIDGPKVWIEYSTQNGIVLSPTHPHSVWRDRTGDYGGNF